ncbi:MAG: sugar transferase [Pseudomonadota bacterium]
MKKMTLSPTRSLPCPAALAASCPTRTPRSDSRAALIRATWQTQMALSLALKRLLDISIATGAVLALSPLLIGTAIAIRLESPGSVLFFQERVGFKGRRFRMIKFRSMRVGADAEKAALAAANESADGVIFKMKQDPRITKVGRLIRRLSIDELPQIFNVLRGDMSIVGPRPPVPGEVEQYSSTERKRLEAKPGLTCLWQIGGRSNVPFSGQVMLDVAYLEKQSLWEDLRIIVKTVPAVLSGRGAY